jgi:hypothetical protein
MKYIKSILISLSILLSISNVASAADKCPGAPATIRWSSANCVPSTFTPYSTSPACKFDIATPNTSGDKSITTGNTVGNFCTVKLSCTGNQGQGAAAEATLNVVDGPQCCSVGTALTEGRNVWSGVKSKCITYPKPILTATTTPASTTPAVKWSCEEPATSYTITRNAPWTSTPAWASGTTTSTTTGIEGAAVDTDTVAGKGQTSYEISHSINARQAENHRDFDIAFR